MLSFWTFSKIKCITVSLNIYNNKKCINQGKVILNYNNISQFCFHCIFVNIGYIHLNDKIILIYLKSPKFSIGEHKKLQSRLKIMYNYCTYAAYAGSENTVTC